MLLIHRAARWHSRCYMCLECVKVCPPPAPAAPKFKCHSCSAFSALLKSWRFVYDSASFLWHCEWETYPPPSALSPLSQNRFEKDRRPYPSCSQWCSIGEYSSSLSSISAASFPNPADVQSVNISVISNPSSLTHSPLPWNIQPRSRRKRAFFSESLFLCVNEVVWKQRLGSAGGSRRTAEVPLSFLLSGSQSDGQKRLTSLSICWLFPVTWTTDRNWCFYLLITSLNLSRLATCSAATIS